jgi:hypothetical protein
MLNLTTSSFVGLDVLIITPDLVYQQGAEPFLWERLLLFYAWKEIGVPAWVIVVAVSAPP